MLHCFVTFTYKKKKKNLEERQDSYYRVLNSQEHPAHSLLVGEHFPRTQKGSWPHESSLNTIILVVQF